MSVIAMKRFKLNGRKTWKWTFIGIFLFIFVEKLHLKVNKAS